MKNVKALLLLLMIFCVQNFRSQNLLQPEKVFNLYFNSFIKYDNESLKELNSYLINFLGKDNTYRTNATENYSKKVEDYTNIFLSNLAPEMASACKKEATNYFTVLMENFKASQYKIKSVKPIRDEKQGNLFFSEVIFEVTMKIPNNASEVKMGDFSKIGVEEMKKYLTDLTVRIKGADKIVTSEQKFNLYEMTEGRDIYYWNGGPEELSWKLNEFYLKNIN
ncbi:hypothetical protein [Chryseobacterium sp. MMS23-Vi53]|uniref:hypothetical protein n=1 Tax=Chryseobacterium sp. MMS23-Vi53 TaxID=3386644 RepID=UPI0039E9CC3C